MNNRTRMIRFDVNKAASFDVDAQKGFTPLCPNELPVPGGDEIVPALNEMSKFACKRIGSKDAHSPYGKWITNDPSKIGSPVDGDYPNMDIKWPSHCIMGTEGAESLPGLPNWTEYDYFVWKGMEPTTHPYSAIYHDLEKKHSTGAYEYLLSHNINTVIVGGLALDFCVGETALDLVGLGIETVIVYLPATRAIDFRSSKDIMMNRLAEAGVVIVDDIEELKHMSTDYDMCRSSYKVDPIPSVIPKDVM